ncbi:hypothetical protein ASG22_08045 [Chryseobacterium sp. Leaf405]|nr:hypothetical protein ASG22_08045 [Chryseobacterium sp. Leaf405]
MIFGCGGFAAAAKNQEIASAESGKQLQKNKTKKELPNQDSSTPKFKTEKVLTFIIKIFFY